MEFLAVLGDNIDLLLRCLAVSPSLLLRLQSLDFFGDRLSEVRQLQTPGDRTESLLTILSTVTDRQHQQLVFDKFLAALRQDGQEHVANVFLPESDARPMSDEHYQLLVNKNEELKQFISPNTALLNRLVCDGVLSQTDKENTMSKSSLSDMSSELVKILLHKPDSSFNNFITALNDTEQQHVVYIITGQGESPLSRVRRLVLRKARDKLLNRVDSMCTSLLAKMISSGVLTDDDKQRIEAHKVNEYRTAELIDVIARKSQHAYDKFLQALKDSGHHQVASELEGLELRGTIDPHFLSGTSIPEISKIFQVIRNNMKALIGGTGQCIEELTSLMEHNGFAVSEISEGSIHISFRCFTVESLVNLKRLYTDKTLDKLFTQVFCPQLAQQGLESLTLNITDEQFDKCQQIFKENDLLPDKHRQTARELTSTASEKIPVGQMGAGRQVYEASRTICQVPMEVLELILLGTFYKLFTDNYKLHYNSLKSIQQAYRSLAAVCYNWCQTMNGWPQSTTKHWFKHKLRHDLRPFRDLVSFDISEPRYIGRRKVPTKPLEITVVGCFSCDDAGEYVDDKFQPQVYCPPKTDVVAFDLNRGYDTWIRRNGHSIDGLLKWLLLHGDVDPVGGQLTSEPPIADLICCRSFIVRLLGTPYETSERSPGWKVAICRYKGVLYADDSKGDNYREKSDKTCYCTCKFPSYVTAADKHSKPDIDAPVNSNRSRLAVVKTRLGNHRVVHVTNVNCYDATTDQPIELKTCPSSAASWKHLDILKNKMQKWYAQGVLSGAEKIICGFEDRDNIVTQLRQYTISELPTQVEDLSKEVWDIEQCYGFCDKFLNHVKQTVKLDYNKAIYVFHYDPCINKRYRKITVRIEVPNSKFAFLPSWFTGRNTDATAAEVQTQ